MTQENVAPRRNPLKTFTRYMIALALLLAACAAAQAQGTTSATDGSTPEGMKSGAPAGSYQLSGFDNVNFFNGNLNFNLPLLRVGGRGAASSAVTLKIERKWSVARTLSNPATYFPESGGWSGLKVGYGPGVLVGRLAGASSLSCGGDFTVDSLLRLTFIAPDGTEYELHDTSNNGYRGSTRYVNCQVLETTPRGREFVTADGSSATFISDEVLQDGYDGAPEQKKPSGYLMLRDGTRYRITEGLVDWVRDRNGNKVSYEYAGERVTKITDSLGREVTFSYGPTLTPPYSDAITYTGFGGTPRTIRVWYGMLGTALRGDQTPKSEHDLFPSLNGADTTGNWEQVVVTSVELPDGRGYRFKYNSYGELARAELPTGGAFEYDWDGGFVPNSPGLYFVGPAPTGSYQVYRRVVERRVYPDGGTGSSYASRMTIGSPEAGTPDLGYAEVKNFDHAGTMLTWERHYFYGSARVRGDWKPTDYQGWKTGREWKTEVFDPEFSTTVPARTTVRAWANDDGSLEVPKDDSPMDPPLMRVQTTLGETGQQSKQEYDYDAYVNRTDVWEYDYWTGTSPPAHPTRHTHTDYVPAAAYVNAAANPAQGASLRSLPMAQQVYAVNPDTGQETPVAKGETRYDEAAYAPLPCGTDETPIACSSAPQWDDPGTAPRGNATTTRRWLDTTNSWLEMHAQYDGLGNLRYTWNARGDKSEVSYLDSFCNGGGGCGAAGYVPHTFAFPTAIKSPKPDPSGTYGSAAELTSSTVYDYYTGLAYSSTDVNNQTTRFEYADPLDRPTAQVRPDGGRTDIYYSQPNEPLLYVRTMADLDGTRRLKSEQYFDKLGRPSRSFTWENQDANNPWLTADTLYDALGRAWKVSNPYRSTGADSVVDEGRAGTETNFDALGRIRQVKTADGASVTTSYAGNKVTVTDQALNKRSSVSDALGRLTDVYEDPDGLNYHTSYQYDALGDLRTVTQGAQTRAFVYDSLGRLTSATNPEACRQEAGQCIPVPTTYEYHPDGSLKQKTDARGVQTSYEYDGLGRVKSRTYVTPEGVPATPTVTYMYDGAGVTGGVPNAKGRLTEVSSSVSAYSYGAYDVMGRVKSSSQTTEGQTYVMSYEYDLAGHLKEETYPSGRKVATGFDAAGRLSSVTGVKAGEADKPYASQIAYAPHGAAAQLKLGNGLWEHMLFNSRLQPREIGLGATASDSGVLKLEYGYGLPGAGGALDATKNNGNLRSQTITVPGAAAFEQTYVYDKLNRLESAEEQAGTTPMWKQVYTYDRYGNRTLAAGTTYPAQLDTTNNPAVSEANNRIISAGYVYDEAGNLKCDALHQCTASGINTAYFDYDAENLLVRAGTGGASAVEGGANYIYDAAGKRVKKVVGNVTTVFIYDAMGMLVAEYGGGQPTAGGTSYLTTDTLGSTRVVTGQNQEVKARYDYLPFGEDLASNVNGRSTVPGYDTASGVRKRFGTYERDTELLDLDFAQARYYNFRHGRFNSVDPLMASAVIVNPQSFNRYAYVGNNPINVNDPTGEIWGELNGAVEWFDTTGDMVAKGFHAYTSHFARINATGQLVILNPNAEQTAEIASGIQAVRQLVVWGVEAAVVAEVAVEAAIPAAAVGVAIAGYYAAEDSLDGRPEAVRDFKMAKWQEKYIDRVLSKMNEMIEAKATENVSSDAGSASSEERNKGREFYFVRFGTGPESAEQLTKDADRTLDEGLPYGVSVFLKRRISGSDKRHRSATVSEAQAAFQIEQTGKNPMHYTVHLPNPVTPEAAAKFNSVFKPK